VLFIVTNENAADFFLNWKKSEYFNQQMQLIQYNSLQVLSLIFAMNFILLSAFMVDVLIERTCMAGVT